MSEMIALQEPERQETPLAKELDEDVWRRWIRKNNAQDRRRFHVRIEVANWIALVVLAVAVVVWDPLAPFEATIRFVVAAGALALVFQTIREREYAAGAIFAAIVVLFNPVAPVLDFSGVWPRTTMAVCVIPFIASLARAHKQRAAAYYEYDQE
jgi:hypothetical protein